MKKNYEKPMILFEDFTMSTNIAAGCNYISNHAENECGYIVEGATGFGDITVYMTSITGCDWTHVDGEYNGICYHGPIDTSDLFNS